PPVGHGAGSGDPAPTGEGAGWIALRAQVLHTPRALLRTRVPTRRGQQQMTLGRKRIRCTMHATNPEAASSCKTAAYVRRIDSFHRFPPPTPPAAPQGNLLAALSSHGLP